MPGRERGSGSALKKEKGRGRTGGAHRERDRVADEELDLLLLRQLGRRCRPPGVALDARRALGVEVLEQGAPELRAGRVAPERALVRC